MFDDSANKLISSVVYVVEWKSYLAVYVDDLLIIGPNETDIIKIKSELSKKFDIEDKGDV